MRLRPLVSALTAAAALSGLSAAPAATATAPAVKLYAMDCGTLTMANADAFSDDGAYKGVPKSMVVPCYLIRHPKGDLIWDTGVPQAIADMPDGKGPGGITVKRKLTDQLKDLRLTPKDIEYLSISHSHFDHIGNAGLFAGSTWIVDPAEKAYAFRDAARKDAAGFAAYSALEKSNIIPVYVTSYDVFGDGSVLVVPTHGHTPGHTILQVKLRKAGTVLLTGDMWHVAESREARRVPRFNVDKAESLRSMDKIEKIAAETKARVVRQHVPEDFTSLPKFPKPLE
jgi:glyoxylase-like metal-dependent hydrolase (beta-lactamase superfamily II)